MEEMNQLDDALQIADSPEELAARLKEIMSQDDKPKREINPDWVDPKDIRADDNDKWNEVVEGDSYPQVVFELLRRSVLLPRANFQLPIAASYLMLPSVFCNRVPILLSQGGSGTGKSTLSHLACGIHNTEPLGAGSTFPSIRNQIRNDRFFDPESGSRGNQNEKNCCLAWEDISSRSLRDFDGKIFDLLKLGVDRKGKISIANMGGSNMEFEVFSPKLISSISPFYAEHDFRELIRRLIVIEHKRYDYFSSTDHSDLQCDIEPDDLLDLQGIDWKGCKSAFDSFWLSKPIALQYAEVRRSIKKSKSLDFPTAYFDMSKDLITTGVVCGFFPSVSTAIEHYAAYFEWHKWKIESQATGTEMVLREFIKVKREDYDNKWDKAFIAGTQDFMDPFRLQPIEIKDFLDKKAKDGELDVNVSPRERAQVMEALGYKLKTEAGTSTNYWYLASE
jgi:hypothetical protein